jgi:hypothetical protein
MISRSKAWLWSDHHIPVAGATQREGSAKKFAAWMAKQITRLASSAKTESKARKKPDVVG